MSTSIPENALIVVADGGKALLLRNTSSEGGTVTLREEAHVTPKNVDEDGPAGARPADQSPHQTAEATFAKQLAHRLSAMYERHAFKAMVLIADARTLGEVREALAKPVEGSIIKSMSKDYTNTPLKQIEAALSE